MENTRFNTAKLTGIIIYLLILITPLLYSCTSSSDNGFDAEYNSSEPYNREMNYYQNIDLTKFDEQNGFIQTENVYKYDTYIKRNVGYFDYVMIYEDEGISFVLKNASPMKWLDIYGELKTLWGLERQNKDYLPTNTTDKSIENVCSLCSAGQARLKKMWLINYGSIKAVLTYEEGGIKLSCSNIKEIIVEDHE